MNTQNQLSTRQLIEQLGSPHHRVRREAYDQLMAKGQAVLDDLLAAMTNENPHIRECCASLMDHLGDDRCIDPLIQATHDPVAFVRRSAVHALACDRCKPLPLDVDLIPRLTELALHDPSTKVRQQAVYGLALRNADKRIVPVFEEVIHEMTAKPKLSKKERGVLFAARWGMNRHQRVRKHMKNDSTPQTNQIQSQSVPDPPYESSRRPLAILCVKGDG
ncbi:HEAT repeat domain-containing protein [Chloroflexi bacterium TSY]|nr:HEAT repeat domain-containing protein [Chloroflexi bacterium TSY]